jgi:ATP-dependent helicase HrpA
VAETSVAELRHRLDGLTLRDAARFGRRLKNLRGAKPEKLHQLAEQIAAAEILVATRQAAAPKVTYPDLPISGRRHEIAEALRSHQVVVVAGETGSGKTTQLPKICLDMGRGIRAMIGHTQPRRLAARTVAQRIADELGSPLGEAVGFSVRFNDHVSERTLVKLMTDGILLAEIQRDRRLMRYDTLIIDEAHERSLNVDFLLGYLHELLPRRPELKVIVTSATIEPRRFATHFSGAPIIEVSGRGYPVEIRYRPLEVPVSAAAHDDPDDPDHEIVRTEIRDEVDAIVDAIHELEAEPAGDVLVFLSGEREIRDTAEALSNIKNTEVLPLYARLPTAKQHKVFAAHTGRRVVLATNVAETSLTVPGVRYVVDPGNARISRYSRRLKVQRLPIEPISQASAAQRAGRCGRVAPGVCIRLYSEEDYAARPRFTDPEILRTNLAAVLLQMAALELGDVEEFPFLDPPDRRSVRDGVQLLQELAAFDQHGEITDLGRRLARLPVDPRLGRMILAAGAEGCVREVLVLAAALTIPDPRERRAEREEAARQSHARFADEHSDFMSYLNLWRHLREQRNELSGNAFRRMCRNEFLHYLRIREWQDLVGQLRGIARELGVVESDEPADAVQVHAALLAGLLSHVGMRREEANEYLGARNSRFLLAPGSNLSKRPPRWVMVAELVETSRLYGRTAARIQPEVVERVAGDRVQRTYSEPHWDAKRGEVMAYERVTLYGLPLAARRRVGYARVEATVARELFLRHALVEGDWQTRHHFFGDNARLRVELEELEERARRRDLLVGDDEVYQFYDARVPADVVSARHFDAWWRKQRHTTPDLLTLSREDLLRTAVTADADRPDVWQAGDVTLPLTYRFEPGATDDGVTVHVPIDVLARLGDDEFAWQVQVPALREELITGLIRSLPKELRRNFVPAPDTARAVLPGIDADREPVLTALQRELRRRTGILVPIDAFDLDKLPAHLRVTFAVESPEGVEIARGKDLPALQQRLAASARRAVADIVAAELERTGLRSWPEELERLPASIERTVDGRAVRGYPAFVDAGSTVDLRVFATSGQQQDALGPGIGRLLRLSVSSPVKAIERQLDPRTRLTLGANPDGSLAALLDDCADAAVAALVTAPVWARDEFIVLRDRVAKLLVSTTLDVVSRVEKVLAAAHEVQLLVPAPPTRAQAEAITDVRAQLNRLDQLPHAINADHQRMAQVHAVQDAYDDLIRALPPARKTAADVGDIAWQIEELRVSLWAQQVGTPRPISEQRIYRAIHVVGENL